MTENGGGRDSDARESDSWFKPSENRYRTQSEYQDPMEEEGTGDTVFPDSGGYAGLSSSRPPMVEPYPEALGGPPQPPPPTAGALSYPGAGASAYEPLTRIPGDPEQEEPNFPGIAASAQVPLPPETDAVPGEASTDTWSAEPVTGTAWSPEPDDAPADEPWSPRAGASSASAADPAVPSFDEPWGTGGSGGREEEPWAAESAPSPAGEPWGAGDPGDRDDAAWSPGAAVSADPLSPEPVSPSYDEPWDTGDRNDVSWAAGDPGDRGDAPWSSGAGASSASAAFDPAAPEADAPWGTGGSGGREEEPWAAESAPSPAGEPWGAGDPGDRDDAAWSPGAAVSADPLSPEPVSPSYDEPPAGRDERPWSPDPVSPSADAAWSPGAAAPADPLAPADSEPWSSGDPGRGSGEPWSTDTATPAAGGTWTPDSSLDRVNESWSSDTPPADEPWVPGAPVGDGLGAGSPMSPPDGPDPLAPRADSWADDELGSDSWGADARSGAPDATRQWDERTDDLETWAPARDGDGTWNGAGTPEPWTGRSADGYDDELSPAPAPAEQAPQGGGTGNTWVFDRDDSRLPDSVREAERRRRENGPAEPEFRDWGADPEAPDSGVPSSSVPGSDDPLGAIADMQTRARSWDEEDVRGEERQPDGATQMFDALPFDDPGSGADRYGTPEYGDGYDDSGYADDAYAEQTYDSRYHDTGYDEDPAEGYDDDPRGAAPGMPSDLGPVPGEAAGPQGAEAESEYDDGFTPADYGMPVEQSRQRRRRDPIAGDFPGFDDRPPGGEVGDAYPGYDSIEFLADTDRGALLTLWLGLASLLPGIGLATAAVALFVTGPKAKRAIRRSNGELDGLGLIAVGTAFAVIGILVTVISVALLFVL